MIVLSIAAILVTVAVPSMSRLIRESQATSSLNDLVYAMRLARNEAVTRKLPVAVCASKGAECTGKNDWEEGWMVLTDPNGNAQCEDDGDRNCKNGGRILHRVRDVADDFRLSATGTPAGKGIVVYDANGFAPGYLGTFTLCDDIGKAGPRGFTVIMSGRLSPKEPADLDCSS
jgi:type IV fimbrial biogenesis protein FimT